ncbi:MAG: imidazole glycerol phosphate synthase subunit HisH [Solirubrobacterales bacterium]|nr:imidazole glycerol phosphate synthase subunit HisH [Solirubrobacterales bacterium]
MAGSGPKIAILDYGMGNLRSVEKALEKVGATAIVTNSEEGISAADGLVLPGVGAFPKAMQKIRELGLDRMLNDAVEAGKPVLGICLGLQLLFESSIEQGGAEGLGLLAGDVAQVPAGGRKVPHIGWAEVTWKKPDQLNNGLRPGEPFYFVHSFVVQPTGEELIGTASYGGEFACVAGKGKVWGVQFHPEKSSSAGLRMLTNFKEICS